MLRFKLFKKLAYSYKDTIIFDQGVNLDTEINEWIKACGTSLKIINISFATSHIKCEESGGLAVLALIQYTI